MGRGVWGGACGEGRVGRGMWGGEDIIEGAEEDDGKVLWWGGWGGRRLTLVLQCRKDVHLLRHLEDRGFPWHQRVHKASTLQEGRGLPRYRLLVAEHTKRVHICELRYMSLLVHLDQTNPCGPYMVHHITCGPYRPYGPSHMYMESLSKQFKVYKPGNVTL